MLLHIGSVADNNFCQELYLKLLLSDKPFNNKNGGSDFIKNFNDTCFCDKYSNLSLERFELTQLLIETNFTFQNEPGIIKRVLKDRETLFDNKICDITIRFYNKKYERKLINSLTWSSWFSYKFNNIKTIFN